MHYKKFILSMLLFALIFLSACLMPPILTQKASYYYHLLEDGNLEIEIVQEGSLVMDDNTGTFDTNYQLWSKDCKGKLISILESALKEDENKLKDANKEVREELQARIELEKYALKNIDFNCEFSYKEQSKTATWSTIIRFTPKTLNEFLQKMRQMDKNAKTLSMEINPKTKEYTIKIPINKKSPVEKIYIDIHGKLIKLEPRKYSLWRGMFLLYPKKLKADEIVVGYIPRKFLQKATPSPKKSSPKPSAKKTMPRSTTIPNKTIPKKSSVPQTKIKDKNEINLFGYKLKMKPEAFLYLMILVLGVLGIIIIAGFLSWKIKRAEEPKKEKKEEKEAKKDEVNASKKEVIESKKIIPEKEAIAIETKERIQKFKEMPIFTSEEEKLIKRVVEVLKDKKDKYPAEKIRKIMLEKGYSEKIADEIIRRLYGKNENSEK